MPLPRHEAAYAELRCLLDLDNIYEALVDVRTLVKGT
jgi:hypothetical protein